MKSTLLLMESLNLKIALPPTTELRAQVTPKQLPPPQEQAKVQLPVALLEQRRLLPFHTSTRPTTLVAISPR